MKKLNYLIFLPIFGYNIIDFVFFIKSLKNEINIDTFRKIRKKIVLFSFFSLIVLLILLFIFLLIKKTRLFTEQYGLMFLFIIEGYILNACGFYMINKHFDEIIPTEINNGIFFTKRDKIIILLGVILGVLITSIYIFCFITYPDYLSLA